MSPTGFEPVTPPLKAECSKTNWATRTLSKWQGSNLRPDGPKPPALPSELHLVIVAEEWGVDPHTFQYRPFSRRGHRPLWLLFQLLISPKVSNLDSLAQNQVSCQLDEGRIYGQYVNELFFVEVSIRFELMTPGYKAGILPTILRDRFFGYKKTRTCFEFGSYISFIYLSQSISTHKWKCPTTRFKRSIAIKRPLSARITNDHMFLSCFHFFCFNVLL